MMEVTERLKKRALIRDRKEQINQQKTDIFQIIQGIDIEFINIHIIDIILLCF